MSTTNQATYANFFVTKNMLTTLFEDIFEDASADSVVSTMASYMAREVTGYAKGEGGKA